jgi:hypothetical protein
MITKQAGSWKQAEQDIQDMPPLTFKQGRIISGSTNALSNELRAKMFGEGARQGGNWIELADERVMAKILELFSNDLDTLMWVDQCAFKARMR